MARKKGDRPAGEVASAEKRRRPVTIYLTTEQWRALKVYAAQHDREMSEVVAESLNKMGIGSR